MIDVGIVAFIIAFFIYLYIVGKYYIQTFLKKRLHIIHGRCIIMQVKQGKCIFIHSISGNTLHPD